MISKNDILNHLSISGGINFFDCDLVLVCIDSALKLSGKTTIDGRALTDYSPDYQLKHLCSNSLTHAKLLLEQQLQHPERQINYLGVAVPDGTLGKQLLSQVCLSKERLGGW
ncbi:MAG: hypothetical protein QM642_09435 [Edaphocola sp.]